VYILFLFLFASVAYAYETPTFPTCSNPSGDLKVNYETGEHAIVGESSLRSGSDSVYWLSNQNALQCFCPDQGMGIQTNWWKIVDLTQENIDGLTKQGWNFIASGRDWGLAADPYLTKNIDYTCNPGGNDNSNGTGGGGETLSSSTGTGGSVLGLAGTGDNAKYIGFLALGVSLALAGFSLRKRIN
jgi:hypothetical protein